MRETETDEVWISHPDIGMSDSPIKRESLPVWEARGWSEASATKVSEAREQSAKDRIASKLVDSGVSERSASKTAAVQAKQEVKGAS